MVQLSRIADEKKFLWDGVFYEEKVKAEQAENSYRNEGFETRVLEEDNRYLVYTRRVVKEAKVQA